MGPLLPRLFTTLFKFITLVVVVAFILLGSPVAPGFASIDTQGEIMEEIIDPCFLAAAEQTRRRNPELYRGMSNDDLLKMMKMLSPEDPLTLASNFEDSMDLQSMTHQERFKLYGVGREMCISKVTGDEGKRE